MDTTRFVKASIRYSWLILLCAGLAGGLAWLVSSEMPKAYESEARVLVGSLTEPDLQQQLGYQQLARTYASLASTPLVLAEAMADSGTEGGVDEVAERVSAVVGSEESIIHIVVTAASPEDAQRLTAAIADRIVQLGTPTSSPAGTLTTPRAASLVTVINPAVVQTDPASPRVTLNAAVAAGVGLAVGLLLTLLLSARFDAQSQREPSPDAEPEPLGYPARSGPYSR